MDAVKLSSDSEIDENAENAVVAIKKRGRPAKAAGKAVEKVKSGRGRGRPPKNPDANAERLKKSNEEKEANGLSNGKRGRPRKVGKLKLSHTITATGKGRGRPKAENGGGEDSALPKKKSSPAKVGRGRPKKSISESDEERSDALDESNNEDDDYEERRPVGRPSTGAVNLNIERTGRGQGRPKKNVAEKRASNSGNEDGVAKKRGRPSLGATNKSPSGKPRGRPKAVQPAESEEDDNEGDASQNNESNDELDEDPEEN